MSRANERVSSECKFALILVFRFSKIFLNLKCNEQRRKVPGIAGYSQSDQDTTPAWTETPISGRWIKDPDQTKHVREERRVTCAAVEDVERTRTHHRLA